MPPLTAAEPARPKTWSSGDGGKPGDLTFNGAKPMSSASTAMRTLVPPWWDWYMS
jgi:hypothetical protein